MLHLKTKFNRIHRLSSPALKYICLLVVFMVGISGCQRTSTRISTITSQCKRIVSFSPSITETLYALNLEKQVVAVTRYCNYPKDAQKKPKVGGGYVDPDTETLLRLHPDLVLVREEQQVLVQRIQALGYPVLTVNHRNVAGILKSITDIGAICHRKAVAQRLVQKLNADIQRIQQKVHKAKTKPRVLIVMDRDLTGDGIRRVFLAGQDGFYNWLIHHAGGETVVNKPGFLHVSNEALLYLNPDVIIEYLPSVALYGSTVRKQWNTLHAINAVQHHQVYLSDDTALVIPGPRFSQTLEIFAHTIHPELDWSKPNNFRTR